MTHHTGQIPGPAQRAARNTALHEHHIESGFWDDHGRPAPWPDDIDDWRPTTHEPLDHPTDQPAF